MYEFKFPTGQYDDHQCQKYNGITRCCDLQHSACYIKDPYYCHRQTFNDISAKYKSYTLYSSTKTPKQNHNNTPSLHIQQNAIPLNLPQPLNLHPQSLHHLHLLLLIPRPIHQCQILILLLFRIGQCPPFLSDVFGEGDKGYLSVGFAVDSFLGGFGEAGFD